MSGCPIEGVHHLFYPEADLERMHHEVARMCSQNRKFVGFQHVAAAPQPILIRLFALSMLHHTLGQRLELLQDPGGAGWLPWGLQAPLWLCSVLLCMHSFCTLHVEVYQLVRGD